MSIYLRGKVYWCKFRIDGRPYRMSTGQRTAADAQEFEDDEKRRIRRQAKGLDVLPEHSPRIHDFAEIYYEHAAKRMKRPERVEDLLRVVLRFFGRRPSGKNPKNPVVEGEPYHDLRLIDLVQRSGWILDFETWMDGRGIAGQTKNQYRSTMTQLYRLAISPLYREQTGVAINPFVGVFRDTPGGRTVTNSIDELRAVLAAASYHVRLAMSIGLLAHKLRLSNVLKLRWKENIDLGRRTLPGGKVVWGWITVWDHKTDHRGRAKPLVVAISQQLYTILEDARRRARSPFVVDYRGRPLKEIRGGVRLACERAGVAYGRFAEGGMTFHTLRHSASTTLAELDVAESKRKSAAGHATISTTQQYTHLRPVHDVDTVEQLSGALPIADVVTVRRRRAGAVPTIVPKVDQDRPERAENARLLDSADPKVRH